MVDFEGKLQKFYEGILKQGMNAVDVGAHVGRHAFEMVRLVGQEGRIFAYEPIPSLYESLKALSLEREDLRNILQVYPYALSNKEGVVDFCFAVDTPGFSGILERVYDEPTRVEHLSVESRKLDEVMDATLPISYIKIDTEGAEWDVIKGGEGLIRKWRPHVSFEFGENSYRAYKVEPKNVYRFFQSINYKLFDILGNEMTAETFSISSVQQSVWDYIASPKEKKQDTASLLSEK